MIHLQWKAVDRPDGSTELNVVYDNGESDHLLLNIPIGAGREAFITEAIRSLIITRGEFRPRFEEVTPSSLGQRKTKSSSPPPAAELLISFLAPKNSAQAQLGDLQEMFDANVSRFGENVARRKYWMQVASSFGPLMWQWLRRIGLVTFVVDYVRSKLGL